MVHQYGGRVARSMVSANRWLRGIKTCRFPWYLTLVSANHASSNPGLTFSLISGRHIGGPHGVSIQTSEKLREALRQIIQKRCTAKT